jgi:hypothetical protein
MSILRAVWWHSALGSSGLIPGLGARLPDTTGEPWRCAGAQPKSRRRTDRVPQVPGRPSDKRAAPPGHLTR